MQEIMNYWDTIDNIKLTYNISLVSQGKQKPYNFLYNYLRNNLIKNYIKHLYNIR